MFDETKPEIVLHLAAQPIVRESYRDPVGTYAANVMGTVHVLECARQCESVRSLVNVTTDKVYENKGMGSTVTAKMTRWTAMIRIPTANHVPSL